MDLKKCWKKMQKEIQKETEERATRSLSCQLAESESESVLRLAARSSKCAAPCGALLLDSISVALPSPFYCILLILAPIAIRLIVQNQQAMPIAISICFAHRRQAVFKLFITLITHTHSSHRDPIAISPSFSSCSTHTVATSLLASLLSPSFARARQHSSRVCRRCAHSPAALRAHTISCFGRTNFHEIRGAFRFIPMHPRFFSSFQAR